MVEGHKEIAEIDLTAANSDNSYVSVASDCNVERFKYLAGYITHRCRQHDRSLVTPTEELPAVSDEASIG